MYYYGSGDEYFCARFFVNRGLVPFFENRSFRTLTHIFRARPFLEIDYFWHVNSILRARSLFGMLTPIFSILFNIQYSLLFILYYINYYIYFINDYVQHSILPSKVPAFAFK